MSSEPAKTRKSSGLVRFALLVLALFAAILGSLWLFQRFSGDSGHLPFEYEGFD